MRPIAWRILALAVLMAGAGAARAANTEVPAGVRVAVAKSPMTVAPPIAMNRLGARPGKFGETWTLDGTQLNRFLLLGGVPAGQPLLRERDRKDKPLPRFDPAMDESGLFDLFSETLTASQPGVTVTPVSLKPAEQHGCSGVLADWRETRPDDDLERSGRVMLCVKDARLYALALSAPSLHYFEQDVQTLDKLLESARF